MNLYMYILKREKKGSHDFIQNLQNYFSLDVKILSFFKIFYDNLQLIPVLASFFCCYEFVYVYMKQKVHMTYQNSFFKIFCGNL